MPQRPDDIDDDLADNLVPLMEFKSYRWEECGESASRTTQGKEKDNALWTWPPKLPSKTDPLLRRVVKVVIAIVLLLLWVITALICIAGFLG